MRIQLSPQRRDDTLIVSRQGDTLTINGEGFDFSSLPDESKLPAEAIDCEWISGPVERIDGEIRLTLILPHGANPAPKQAFPEPIIDPPDGEIALPGQETPDAD